MGIKSEKGYTGVDIAVSIAVIFIFVSIIAALIYRFNSEAREIELKSNATQIAISEIEDIKLNKADYFPNEEGNTLKTSLDRVETNEEGFFKEITVEDYADIKEEIIIPNLVKKVTVKISYMYKAEERKVELSTIISKENEI